MSRKYRPTYPCEGCGELTRSRSGLCKVCQQDTCQLTDDEVEKERLKREAWRSIEEGWPYLDE